MTTKRLEGAMTAIVTPMRDGAVDFDALERIIDHQLTAGIDAIVPVGTTGESATLSPSEQADVIAATVKQVAGRVPVIAGASANDTARAVAFSKAAAKAGADALLHVTPYYNKPPQEGLYRHFLACADATDRPVVLYNVPGRTACDLLPETVERLADHERVVAIKEATGDMGRAAELIRRVGDRLLVLSGDDFTAFPLMCLGGNGVISVVSNVDPKPVADMWDAVRAGNYEKARALNDGLLPLVELLFAETSPIPTKAALELIGLCSAELRSPLCDCSPELAERLRKQLKASGLMKGTVASHKAC